MTLFARLGVDYRQWKAVSRTLLASDFRVPLGASGSTLGRAGSLLTVVVFLALYGLVAAVVVVVVRDVLLAATLALSYLTVMLVTSLLTQHGATLLSTADYVILGSRPVSSRTFFAIRLTNVLFHALLLTTLMVYPVAVAYAWTRGAYVSVASLFAAYAWCVTVTLVIVASYSVLLRAVGARRFHHAVGYLQMVAGVMAYGGLFFGSRVLTHSSFAGAAFPDRWWVACIPPAWFASYIEIIAGQPNSTTAARALISAAFVFGLVYTLGSRLSVGYARELAELPVSADRIGDATVRTPFFTSGEARAVAVLVLAHFRHDLRVRMGILAVVPLVVLYLLIGTTAGAFDLVALSVLLFPAVLLQHFASTDAYRASWIYETTPADRGRLVIALKNLAVMYFLLPFLLFIAAVFAWQRRDPAFALVHTTILGVLSHVALQGALIISPRLPFALPPDKLRGNASLFGWMFVVILGGQAVVAALDRWIYVAPARTAAVVAALTLTTLALERAVHSRAGD